MKLTPSRLVASINYQSASVLLRRFVANTVARARANGVVIGMSGGLDSTVATFLATSALDKERVLGLILPDSAVTPRTDVEDARTVARALGIEGREVDIRPFHAHLRRSLQRNRLAEGNLRARIRMCLLYYHANVLGRLVLGTGDRSEALVGYFTKYGDGGVDFLPLGGLYKTQVRALGQFLGAPANVLEKQSSPRLWLGHEAEDELGLPYETLDPILHGLFDLRLPPAKCARAVGVDTAVVRRVIAMHRQTAHKRQVPPVGPIARG